VFQRYLGVGVAGSWWLLIFLKHVIFPTSDNPP